MHRSLCILIAVLCALPQESAREELSLEQELAALIEKTNALETFHLVYDMEGSEEDGSEKGSLELLYRGPDFARVRMSSIEIEVDMWLLGKHMYALADGAWRSAVFPEQLPAGALLDELFPPDDMPLGPGAVLTLQVSRDPGTGKTGFQLNFQVNMGGRSAVLGWLAEMRRRSSEILVDGASLALAGEGYRYFVSRETGFLERLEITSESKQLTVRLRESHLDEPLDPSLVTLPAGAQEAPIDQDLNRTFEQVLSIGKVRKDGFLRVEWHLETKKRAWNELTRRDWRTLTEALHREMIGKQYSGWLEELSEYGDEWALWVGAQRALDDSPEHRAKLEKWVRESRDKLEENFDGAEAKYTESLPPIESNRVEPRQELFDIELEVIAKLFDELVRQPALESFDQKLDAAFEE